MVPVTWYLLLAAVLFAIGPAGALTRLFFDALTGSSAWRPLGTEVGVWGILAGMSSIWRNVSGVAGLPVFLWA